MSRSSPRRLVALAAHLGYAALIAERTGLGLAAIAAPERVCRAAGFTRVDEAARVSTRMFGLRHLALGAWLVSVRGNPRARTQALLANAAVEASDALSFYASRKHSRGEPAPFTAPVALIGALGCLAVAASFQSRS